MSILTCVADPPASTSFDRWLKLLASLCLTAQNFPAAQDIVGKVTLPTLSMTVILPS